MQGTSEPLHFVTYLSPSLPAVFFERVAQHVGGVLGRRVLVAADERVSGPGPSNGVALDSDVAFVCAPSAAWLSQSGHAVIVAAPVFEHPASAGRPVYFSEVVVRSDDPAQSEGDLAAVLWAVNDTSSLSGYFSILRAFRDAPPMHVTGSHLDSIRAVVAGEVRAAAIDSTVMALASTADPALISRLRVVTSWGPFPVQPVVVSTRLASSVANAIRGALVGMSETAAGAAILAAVGGERFVAADASMYPLESGATGPPSV